MKVNIKKLYEAMENQLNQEDFDWFDFDALSEIEGITKDTYIYCWDESSMELDEAFDTVIKYISGNKVLENYSFYIDGPDFNVFVVVVKLEK